MQELPELQAKLEALYEEARQAGLERSFCEVMYEQIRGFGKVKNTRHPNDMSDHE